MNMEAIESVTDQFDKVNGIAENMDALRHLSDVLGSTIENVLLATNRRRDDRNGYVAINFSKREIEFLLWAAGRTRAAADILSEELDTARERLIQAQVNGEGSVAA